MDKEKEIAKKKNLEAVLKSERIGPNASVKHIGSGASNDCYLIDNSYVLRILNNSRQYKDVALQTQEYEVIKKLQKSCPESGRYFMDIKKIEHPEGIAAYSVCSYVDGEQLDWNDLKNSPKEVVNKFGKQMADAIYAVHSIPLEDIQRLEIKELKLREMLDEELSAVEQGFKKDFSKNEWGFIQERYLQYKHNEVLNTNSCLIHNDLRAENFKVNPATMDLTGILDFGNMIIANPFFEFLKIHPCIAEKVYDFYPDKNFIGDKNNFNNVINNLSLKRDVRWLYGYMRFKPEKTLIGVQRVKDTIRTLRSQ